jgi:Fe-S-cluster-containing dehydrogenase component/DMSO reductase anchor subunit
MKRTRNIGASCTHSFSFLVGIALDSALTASHSSSVSTSAVRLPLLVDAYLREQRTTTPVERFAELHASTDFEGRDRYQDLVPVHSPKPGQQLAFQVDLDACTACQACVTACHRLNGLDAAEAETWRAVGLLQGGTPQAPVQQSITSSCHHCVEPACMSGCPVNAYEKDAVTGIVRHLDDQCIGCQYCTLTCPYEVPQYNRRLGIVRKCDMCADRLAVGEAPACVQACPNEAISIRIVDTAQVIEEAQAGGFLPGAASPAITMPTTSYVSERPLPKNALPANFYRVRGSQAHTPLTWMLVLTQWSVGMFLADFALGALDGNAGLDHAYRGLFAAAVGIAALLASVLHLGRPRLAMRAWVGLRTSWLSREILAFGLFAVFSLAYAGLVAWPELHTSGPASAHGLAQGLAALVAVSGAAGVFCSVMLYAATRRQLWTLARTSFRFATTVALGALATELAMALAENVRDISNLAPVARQLAVALALTASSKLLWEVAIFVHLRSTPLGELKRSALLLQRELSSLLAWRLTLGGVGGVLLPLVILAALGSASLSPVTLVCLAIAGAVMVVSGELVERTLFFRAVSVPTMPGGIGR